MPVSGTSTTSALLVKTWPSFWKICGRRLPERRVVVENVEAAAKGGEDQIVLAFLNGEVADGNGGKIAAQADPLLAAVDGEEQAELGADEEEIGVDGVLSDGERGAIGGEVAADGSPIRAAIGALQDVGLEVVVLVVVKECVDGIRVVASRRGGAGRRRRTEP